MGPSNITLAQVAQYNQQANATTWPIVQSQTPPGYLPIALAYQDLFYQSWNRTFTAGSYTQAQLLYTPDPTAPLFRAENVTKGYPGLPLQPAYYNITLPYFASQPLPPQTLAQLLPPIRYFTLYPACSPCQNWNDPTAIRSFTLNILDMILNPNSSQQATAAQIYDCFVVPSLSCPISKPSIPAYASFILHSYDMTSYPIQPTTALNSQFVSATNNTMLMILDFKTNGADPRNSVQEIRRDVQFTNLLTSQNLTVYVTGNPAFNYDIESETVSDVERIDPITVILIIIIIGLFFASLTAPMVPVSAIGLSVGVSFGLVYVIGTLLTSIHFLVLTLLPVAMFGAGSDYCIFLVSRYAEERRQGRPKNEAVERAVTWAGESIATSGATVVIAFGSLALASFGMLRSIGVAVMLGISVALLVSITLVPAVLSLVGDRVFWPSGVNLWRGRRKKSGESYYRRAARFTARHSKLIILLALVVSVPATSNVLSSQTSHDFIAQVPNSLESKAGYNTMSNGFGPGTVTPTYTIVQTPVLLATGSWINVTALRSFSYAENSTLNLPGVTKVYGLTHPFGEAVPYFTFNQLNTAQQQQMISNMKPFLGSDEKSGMVWAVLSNEPYSDLAIKTLDNIRNNVGNLKSHDPLLGSSSLLVGGATASVADLVNTSSQDYLNMITLVMLGVFIVLLVALGSVFTPLRLIFTILLSVSWAMAGVLFVSQTYLNTELIWILPIMLLVIMVGLGLDYDIFLVTRIREYVVGGASDEEAIEKAVEHTGGIITASGLVTAGAFSTMMLSHIPMLQQLGLGIFIVVLLDAGLIRIYLVPSIMMHMKRLNWWAPGPLRRVPLRPSDGRTAPMSLKTKVTLLVVGLGACAFAAFGIVDYAMIAVIRSTVSQSYQNLLGSINLQTGLILVIVSFAASFILMYGVMTPRQTKPEPSGVPGAGRA
jgi:putative drug exporter of the RND superfamily